MRNPLAFAVGLIVIIILITGAVLLTRNALINRVKSQALITASPSPSGFSAISSSKPATNTPLDKSKTQALAQNQTKLKSQPDTGVDKINNVGIALNFPLDTDTVSSPIKVSGSANVYDGIVKIRVKDTSGNVLGENFVNACMGTDSCPFETTVTFSKPSTSTGIIEAWGKDQNQKNITQTLAITFK